MSVAVISAVHRQGALVSGKCPCRRSIRSCRSRSREHSSVGGCRRCSQRRGTYTAVFGKPGAGPVTSSWFQVGGRRHGPKTHFSPITRVKHRAIFLTGNYTKMPLNNLYGKLYLRATGDPECSKGERCRWNHPLHDKPNMTVFSARACSYCRLIWQRSVHSSESCEWFDTQHLASVIRRSLAGTSQTGNGCQD